MKFFRPIFATCCLLIISKITYSQIQVDSSINPVQTFSGVNPDSASTDSSEQWTNFKFSKKDIQKIIKTIKYSQEVYQIIKRDYSSLFEMNGYHPHLGYNYQGINSFYLGLGYGKRNLFKPTVYSNLHGGLILTPSDKVNPQIGFNLGYTKSKLLTFWGVEIDAINQREQGLNLILRPELGLTLIGSFHIGYGYGFKLNSANSGIGGHTFTVRYTHQFLKKNIERKVEEFNFIFRRDYRRLKEIGLDLAQ